MGVFFRFSPWRLALAPILATALSGCSLLAQRPWQGPRYAVNPKALAAGCPGFAAPDLVGAPPQIDFAPVAPSVERATRGSKLVLVGTVGQVVWVRGKAGGAAAVVTFRSAIPLKVDSGLTLRPPIKVGAPGGFALNGDKCVHEVDVGEWIEAGKNYLVFASRLSDTHELWSSSWYEIGPRGLLSAVPFTQRPFLNGKPAAEVEADIRAEALKETSK